MARTYINLTDEFVNEIEESYQELNDNEKNALSGCRQQLEEICTNTHYKPIIDFVNGTIERLREDIREAAQASFDAWTEGEGSFSAIVKTSQAGDEALATATGIETHIRDIFDTFWSSSPLGDNLQTPTNDPNFSDDIFDTMKEAYQNCYQEIKELEEEALRALREKGEDNPTYTVAIPAYIALSEPIVNAFTEFCTEIDKAKEEGEAFSREQQTKNEEAENAAVTELSQAEIAEDLKVYDDL